MNQTLLALAAVVSFTYYAYGRHQSDLDVERRALSSETELAATEVATAVMGEVLQLAWDHADVGTTAVRILPPTSGLGPDKGEAGASAYNDIDDFDGLKTQRSVSVGAGELQFDVQVEVEFVDAFDPEKVVASPTLAKRVEVWVKTPAAAPGSPSATVKVHRVVSPTGPSPKSN